MCIEVYARLHRCNRISTFGADPGGNEQSEGEYGSVTRTDLVKPELHHLSWATPGTLVVCIIQVVSNSTWNIFDDGRSTSKSKLCWRNC